MSVCVCVHVRLCTHPQTLCVCVCVCMCVCVQYVTIDCMRHGSGYNIYCIHTVSEWLVSPQWTIFGVDLQASTIVILTHCVTVCWMPTYY